jgi:outer membrane lipoprotein-sorting protein
MQPLKRLAFAATAGLGLMMLPAVVVPVAAIAEDPSSKAAEKPAAAQQPSAAKPATNKPAADKPADKPTAKAVPVPVPATKPGEASPPAAAGSAWNTEIAPAQSGDGLVLNPRQTEIVNKVSGYFADLSTLQGNFVQIGADNKRMRGKFYVKRPGRFRFDYARPSRQIVISDGRYLAIQDLDLNNEDRVALDETPFRLLLRTDVNLVRDARIVEVQEAEDLLVVTLEDKGANATGRIKLYLATKPMLELKEWVTRDPQGLDTRVEVSDLAKSVELDGDLFQIKPVGKHMTTP